MADEIRKQKRPRGSIRRLKSGSLQVRVYAGVDPVRKKDLYLSQVDEKRNPKTRATIEQLMKRYVDVLDFPLV